MSIQVEDTMTGRIIPPRELRALFAMYEKEGGLKKGALTRSLFESVNSEAARWDIFLGSNFDLGVVVEEVAA